jgi:hypothetical protein
MGPVEPNEPGAFPWPALTQPGLIRAGSRWLSLAPRMWIHWASRIARDALDRTLERPVSVEALSDSERLVQKELSARGLSPREAAFAVALSHPAFGEAHVVLDLTAARIVVDSLESDFASVRGAETLSDAEHGLVEYATLACVDHALRDIAPAGQALAITDFPDPAKFRDSLDADQRFRTTLRLRVGGRQGFVRVFLAAFPAEPPDAPAGHDAASEAAAGTIELRVAFPPLKLSRDELKSLRPGDVLLTGISDMTSTAGFRLATTSGWTLAPITVTRDSATSMTVQAGPVRPDVREIGDADRILLTPLIGRVPVTLEQLRRSARGGTFELQKDGSSPVEVFDGTDRVARGELVKIDDEIGIRLLECRRPT